MQKYLPKHGFVSIGEASRILGVSIKTIRRWDKAGKVESKRLDGKNRYFKLDSLKKLKEEKPLTVSQAAKKLGVSSITLRRLDKKGVFTPKRSQKNFRHYHPREIESFILKRSREEGNSVNNSEGKKNKFIKPFKDFHFLYKSSTESIKTSAHTRFSFGLSRTFIVSAVLFVLLVPSLFVVPQFLKSEKKPSVARFEAQTGSQVLGVSTSKMKLNGTVSFNIPAIFNDDLELKGDLLVNDKKIDLSRLSGSVVTGLTAGTGISVGSGQSPEIKNTGVTSFQGSTGTITLTAGTGITIDGTKITNSLPEAAQNVFKTIKVSSTTFDAGSSTDTLEFAAGSGISITSDTSNKKLTIAGSSTSGWASSGTYVYLSTSTNTVGIGTSTPSSFALQVAGNVGADADNTYNLGSSSKQWANIYGVNIYQNGVALSQLWQRTSGSLAPLNVSDSVNLGATATTSALVHFTGTSGDNSWLNTGNVGIGTTSPSVALDVNGAASLAGNLTFAGARTIASKDLNALTIGNSSTGDLLFTTGTSRQVRFYSSSNYIDSSGNLVLAGNLTVPGTTTLRGVAYTWPSADAVSSGYVLSSNASGQLSWIAQGGGTNWFKQTAVPGAITPINNTMDLLVGGDSTSAAKFAFMNVNSGTATASISGNLTLNSAGIIQSTQNQTLTIGGDSTGDINIKPQNGSGKTSITGNFAQTSSETTATAHSITADSVTTGKVLDISADGLTSGIAINLQSTSTSLEAGKLISADQTVTYTGSKTISGNVLNLSRASTINASAGTLTIDSTSSGAGTSSSSLTFSHTVGTGDNRYLVVSVASNKSVSSVTYAGTTMDSIGTHTYNTTTIVSQFGLKAPASGANNIVVTLSASGNLQGGGISFSNVDQTTPASGFAYGEGAGTTATTTVVSTTSDIVVDVVNLGTSIPNAGAGQTVQWRIKDTNMASGGSTKTGAVSTSMTWTWSGSKIWSSAGVSINHATTVPLTITGALASLTSNCTVTQGSCTDSASLLSLTQNYTSATGAVLKVANSGTGPTAVFTGGNVGVGTASPVFMLDVTTSQAATVSAMITNSSTNADADVLALKVGATTVGTANRYLTFLDGNGDIVGDVQGNGSGGVTYATTGIDFAEYYLKSQILNLKSIDPGTLVCLADDGGVLPCDSSEKNLLGIVSDRAGFVGGGDHAQDPNYVLVGLVGQLPVKVASESGTINSGDPLTSSNITGAVKKATNAGFIIGRALESSAGKDKILVSLGVTWYDPSVFITDAGNLSSATNADSSTLPQTNQVSSISYLVSGGQNIPNTTYQIQHTDIASISARLDQQNELIKSLSSKVELNSQQMSSVSALLSKFENLSLTPFASNSADMVTIKDGLMVVGPASLSDVYISNQLSIGSLTVDKNSINVLGTDLEIQPLKQGGINFLGGLVAIDPEGNLKVGGNAEFAKDVAVSGVLSAKAVNISKGDFADISDTESIASSSAGTSLIKSGKNIRKINSSLVKNDSLIYITPLSDTNNQTVYISNQKEGESFTVSIKNQTEADIKFNFLIINVK